jgi:integrase/recombinase XerD
MRWTRLAIRDAMTLERGEIQFDQSNKLHCIVTLRQKTGTHVSRSSPMLPKSCLAVLNGNSK